MNWLRALWNKLRGIEQQESPAASATPSPNISELFEEICADVGCGSKILKQTNAVELFVEWYDGPANKEAILESIPLFMRAHGGIVLTKLKRFFK